MIPILKHGVILLMGINYDNLNSELVVPDGLHCKLVISDALYSNTQADTLPKEISQVIH
jgi:hypothetical protein